MNLLRRSIAVSKKLRSMGGEAPVVARILANDAEQKRQAGRLGEEDTEMYREPAKPFGKIVEDFLAWSRKLNSDAESERGAGCSRTLQWATSSGRSHGITEVIT